jgi:hypothetical protein
MSEPGMSRPVDAARFASDPSEMMWMTRAESLAMPSAKVEQIQLEALSRRFDQLKDKLPPLRRLAQEQGVDQIGALDDGAKLLFKHSVYKSYPISLIEKNRFDKLTQWLANLTTADLSNVRTDGLESIDDWLDALLRDAGVRIIHTTGTSGKLSFLPRGPEDARQQLRSFRLSQEELGQPEPEGLADVPVIVVGQRIQFNGYGSSLEALLRDLYHGNEAMIYVMDEGRLSADVVSLSGRLATAQNRGELGREQIPPALLNRLEEFREAMKTGPTRRAAFFKRVFGELAGKRVMMSGNWTMYHEMAEAGRELGVTRAFAPGSLFLCAGGTKGKVLPEGFKENIYDVLGLDGAMNEGYGMSEITSLMPKCAAGKYHAPPWLLVFLLDPETGEPSPREGTHTGRFGVIDLTFQERWGGILSGDEVTMTFGTCACGLEGPHLDATIRRYGENEGGDDKITCAGAPEAHDNALAFLAELD